MGGLHGEIHDAERDDNLSLYRPDWVSANAANLAELGWKPWRVALPDRGERTLIGFEREITIELDELLPEPSSPSAERPEPAPGRQRSLWEGMLRFPAAPIYGTNRLPGHLVDLEGRIAHMHTMRVFAPARPTKTPDRVHILHNGLNETDRMDFYQRMASLLLDADQHTDGVGSSIVLLRPFPGHLTRFPFGSKYSQTPLSRFLADAGDLFRQYLRFMVESQWLLSTIAPRSAYNLPSGALLKGASVKGTPPGTPTRLDSAQLAGLVLDDMNSMLDASKVPTKDEQPPPLDVIEESIRALRYVCGTPTATSADRPEADEIPRPSIHLLGYSLGGFTAQSVFSSWPFLIGSCTTMLSGGALRKLAPTAFADPEEWQSVLHALRYESDEAFLAADRLQLDDRAPEETSLIAGVDADVFRFLVRTFYEVFQQEFSGPYRSWVSEHSQRLLYVLGGSDPIVLDTSVLDAAPKGEGVNMIEIANLSHFIGQKGRSDAEVRQRNFWLPQVARVITDFAGRAEAELARSHANNWLKDGLQKSSRSYKEFLTDDLMDNKEFTYFEGELASPMFERYLDSMVAAALEGGHLFIAQNTMPAVLMRPGAILRHGQHLHHSDHEIMVFTAGVRRRRSALRTLAAHGHLTVMLPDRMFGWTAKEAQIRPPRAEGAPGMLPIGPSNDRLVNDVIDDWTGSLLSFSGLHGDEARWDLHQADHESSLRDIGVGKGLQRRLVAELWGKRSRLPGEHRTLASLPDAWTLVRGADGRKEAVNRLLDLADAATLHQALGDDQIRMVTVSAARFNPRYRGRATRKPPAVQNIARHTALALLTSMAAEQDRPPPDR